MLQETIMQNTDSSNQLLLRLVLEYSYLSVVSVLEFTDNADQLLRQNLLTFCGDLMTSF